ncbi:TPA: helix-turn-helix domain-containing protein [Klebsiella pneumoniae]|nr:helix-turn-helix domain-containing protein [Klebsiella pneumoniae]
MTALDNAIRVAGSANKLASTLGVSGMAVSQWKNGKLQLHFLTCSLQMRRDHYWRASAP